MTGQGVTTDQPLGVLDIDQIGRRLDGFLLERMRAFGTRFVARLTHPRLTWNRLDVAIKLNYLEQTAEGRRGFARDLYDAHIHAFSLGDFREPGNDAKTDASSFRDAFDTIVDSVRRDGFDAERSLLPVASDGTFINGGHRAAAAMFLGLPVPVVETGLPPVRYDSDFFERRGMDPDLVTASLLAYVDRSPATALVIGGGERPETLCRRLVPLGERGLANLRAALPPESRLAERLPSIGPIDVALTDRPPPPTGPGLVVPGPLHGPSRGLVATLLSARNVALLGRADADVIARLRDGAGATDAPAVLGPCALLDLHGLAPCGTEAADPSGWPSELKSRAGSRLLETQEDPRRHLVLGAIRVVSAPEALRWAGDHTPANRALVAQLRRLARQDRRLARNQARRRHARLLLSRLRRAVIHAARRVGLRAQLRRAYLAMRRPRT